MTTLTAFTGEPSDVAADVLVLAVTAGDDPRVLGAEHLPAPFDVLAPSTWILGPVTGPDEVVRIPVLTAQALGVSAIVLTGLGNESLGTAPVEDIRRAFGAAARSLHGIGTAALFLPGTEEQVAAAAEGALLGAYAFTAHRGPGSDPQQAVGELLLVSPGGPSPELETRLETARIIARAVHGARDLVNTPPNVLSPEAFARAAAAGAAEHGIGVEVLEEAALAEHGYGGIVGVGRGSERPPRLVVLSYRPDGSGDDPADAAPTHVALVGKGITFDSGGLSLKPAKDMWEMTSDMAGAAAVYETIIAAAELRLPIAVTAYLALAENLPDGGAQRPGDVVSMRNAKTVAVYNTDAEGRMVLADALVDAVALEPDLVIDIATLTGAQEVALGMRTGAVMGTSYGREVVTAAADDSGEPYWPMPFPSELRAELDNPIADLQNIGSGSAGGMLLAGVFLREFVGDAEWAHLDIAGPAWVSSTPWGYNGRGATGAGVRTLVQVLTDLAADRL